MLLKLTAPPLIALYLAFSGVAQATHWQDKQYIEGSFFDIALRGEYERVPPRIRKWNQPLRIWVEHGAGHPGLQQHLLMMHLTHLGNIVQLPFEFVAQRSQANVSIFFTDTRKATGIAASEIGDVAVDNLDHSICLGNIRFNGRSEITRAIVIIPVDRAQENGKLVSCIVEEITQMLGLVNDSRFAYPTVFSDRSGNDLLTGLDYLLIKLLYLPELRSGMTISQAVPVIRRHLDTWEMDGTIESADTEIADSPLYAFVGNLR